jgi:hypothetical protein
MVDRLRQILFAPDAAGRRALSTHTHTLDYLVLTVREKRRDEGREGQTGRHETYSPAD